MSKLIKDNEYYIKKFNELVKVGDTISSNDNKNRNNSTISLVVEEGDNWTPMHSEDSEYRKLLPYALFVSDKKDEIISVAENTPQLLKLDRDRRGYKVWSGYMSNGKRRRLKLYNIKANVFGSYCYGKAKDILDIEGIYAYESKNDKKLGINTHHMNADDNSVYETEHITNKAHSVIDSYKTKNKNNVATIDNFMQTKLFPLAAEEAPDQFTIFICERGETQEGRLFNYQGLFESNEIVLTEEAVPELETALTTAVNEYIAKGIIDELVTKLICKYQLDYFYTTRYFVIWSDQLALTYSIKLRKSKPRNGRKKVLFDCTLLDVRKLPATERVDISNLINVDYFDGKEVILCSVINNSLAYQCKNICKNDMINNNKTNNGAA